MEPWQIDLIHTLVMIALVIVGYFMKRSITQIDESFKEVKSTFKEQIAKHDEKISDLEEKIHDVREYLPQQFVMRDDYIRAMAGFGARLDKNYDILNEIRERLAAEEKRHATKSPNDNQ